MRLNPKNLNVLLFADLPSPLNPDGGLENDDDLADLINSGDLLGNGGSEAIEGRDVTLASSALPFSPDEEDVENQLMHIDDQLIRLDGSIDNIEQVSQPF